MARECIHAVRIQDDRHARPAHHLADDPARLWMGGQSRADGDRLLPLEKSQDPVEAGFSQGPLRGLGQPLGHHFHRPRDEPGLQTLRHGRGHEAAARAQRAESRHPGGSALAARPGDHQGMSVVPLVTLGPAFRKEG